MRLQDLYEKYRKGIKFLVIYFRETHPVDGWWLGSGLSGLLMKLAKSKAALDVIDPTSLSERQHVADRCETTLAYGIRTYVDDMADSVNHA